MEANSLEAMLLFGKRAASNEIQYLTNHIVDPGTIEGLARQIGERAGRTVKLATRVDPEILGGLVVRVGNSILDASIRNRLEQLRRHVAQGAA